MKRILAALVTTLATAFASAQTVQVPVTGSMTFNGVPVPFMGTATVTLPAPVPGPVGPAGPPGPASSSGGGASSSSGSSASSSSGGSSSGAATFIIRSAVSPASVAAGGTLMITTSVTASAVVSNAMIDVEVHSQTDKLAQTTLPVSPTATNGVTLPAGVPLITPAWAFTVPAGTAPGTYSVQVGVFGANWGPLLYYSSTAGSFTVTSSSSGGSSSGSSSSGGSRTAALLSVIANATEPYSGQHVNYWDSNPLDQFTGQMPNLTIGTTGIVPAILGVAFSSPPAPWSPSDPIAPSNAWIASGGIVQASWWPTNPSTGANDGVHTGYTFSDVYTPGKPLNTTWNSYLDSQIALAKQISGPFLYRPFVELDGSWNWYGAQPTAQFIALWQYTYNYMTSRGVTNALWVFNLNGYPGTVAYYPGDGYVNVISFDEYTNTPGIAPAYANLASVNKPMIMAEAGVSSFNANSGDYGVYLTDVKAHYPRVRAVVVWCQGAGLVTQNGTQAFMQGTLGRSSVPKY